MTPKMSRFKVVTLLLCVAAICVFVREPYPRIFSQKLLQQQGTHICACGKCSAGDNAWFRRRFNPSVELFLSAEGNLSEDAFNWWKGLQGERCSFTTYRETVKSLFEIFPPSPSLLEPRPERCRTCAVVGNSINLKGSRYGALIDGHDVIIRMNYGHTTGYEADVGNRTTHHVMYPESSLDLDSTTHLVLLPFKLTDFEWLTRVFTSRFPGKKYGSVKAVIRANRDLVMVLNPAFMKYIHEVWLEGKGKYPSTGFMSVVLALYDCGEVDVFGYGADKDGNWSHYWEKPTKTHIQSGVHPGSFEYEIIQELAEKHKIRFYSGL